MMIKFVAMVVLVFLATANVTTAQEDCGCGHSSYVTFVIDAPVELDENSWRVTSVERFDIDLTKEDEPEVCVVQLQLILPTDPILYQDFQEVPLGDIELWWGGHWILASEFENQMDASQCEMAGTMS